MALAPSYPRLYAPGVPLGQPLHPWMIRPRSGLVSMVRADYITEPDCSLITVFCRGSFAGTLLVVAADEQEIVARLIGEACARTPDREAIQVLMDELQDAAQKQDVEAVIVARRRLLAAFDALLADAPKEVPE